jgi:CDP-diacylglycerol--glycerol-3-phosphate 3-phosphatidyltransferase
VNKILTKTTNITELRIWTISNFLSLSRVLLLPFIYHYLKDGGNQSNRIALILMLVGVMSDIMDGLVARRTGVESNFGKILDPLADKICIGTMILILASLRGFPLWLIGIVIARDILIVVSASILIKRNKVVISANGLGKATTLFMALLIFAYTLEWQRTYLLFTVSAIFFLLTSTTSYGIGMHRQLYSVPGAETGKPKPWIAASREPTDRGSPQKES